MWVKDKPGGRKNVEDITGGRECVEDITGGRECVKETPTRLAGYLLGPLTRGQTHGAYSAESSLEGGQSPPCLAVVAAGAGHAAAAAAVAAAGRCWYWS